jgi:hypothetical protein
MSGPQPSHADIMRKLHDIDARLVEGGAHFTRLDAAVKPITQLVEAVGGEEQFQKVVVEAARGLAALAVIGAGAAALGKWVAIIAGGFVAIGAAGKYLTWDWWQ